MRLVSSRATRTVAVVEWMDGDEAVVERGRQHEWLQIA